MYINEMIMSILAIVLAVLAIVYSGHVAIVYQRFNDQIKSWSENIDASTKDAIERSARQILRELDEKITEEKQKENVESLNNNENE
jgi:Na+-translocating ferredoxin:NAD+ oxidoreductase RnfG subunit